MDFYESTNLGSFFLEGATAANGRLGNLTFFLLHRPLASLGITYTNHQWLFYLIDFAVLALSLTILFRIFTKNLSPQLSSRKASLFIFLALGLLVINPFMVESLAFMLPSHPQALLCVALALYFLTKSPLLKPPHSKPPHHTIRNYLLSALFLTGAVLTYQNYYIHFIILSSLLIVLAQNNAKANNVLAQNSARANNAKATRPASATTKATPTFYSRIRQNYLRPLVKPLSLVFISLLIWLAATFMYRIFNNTADAKTLNFTLSLPTLFSRFASATRLTLHDLANGYGLYFISPILLVSFALLALPFAFTFIKQRRFKHFFLYGFTVLATFSLLYLHSISSDGFYLAPRILLPFFALLTALLLANYTRLPRLQLPLSLFLAIFTIANILATTTTVTDLNITNRIELAELSAILTTIKNHESTTNSKIDTIVIYSTGQLGEITFDHAHLAHKNGFKSSHFLTATPWSDVAALEFLSRHPELLSPNTVTSSPPRSFTRQDPTTPIETVFPNFHLTQLTRFLPEERLKFDQNTLYWVTY
ncbi:glucosyltransferase domain-containing protein [Candidatus Saccharibacteria bacterium]|nr:glucosyltransferase domain-containing protein [Candidatus Saccharibacteria bacterium]